HRQEAVDRGFAKAPDRGGIEILERLAVRLALAQDRHPAETGLGALQHQELEEQTVVVDRHAPFAVVIIDQQRIALCPTASLHAPTLPSPASGGGLYSSHRGGPAALVLRAEGALRRTRLRERGPERQPAPGPTPAAI